MELTTEYNPLWLFAGILVAAGYAWFLYYYDKKNLAPYSRKLQAFLALLRFLLVAALFILLLNPLLRTVVTEIEKPLIIIAQDNSASLLNVPDSANFRKSYPARLRKLIDGVSAHYEVRTVLFGDKVSTGTTPAFNEKYTDFSLLFRELEKRYDGANIGGLILLSDGVFNRGANPEYYRFGTPFPIYTVGLGDTTRFTDIAILDVRANDIAYAGNRFPIEVSYAVEGVGETSLSLTLLMDGKPLDRATVRVTGDRFTGEHVFYVLARKKGRHRFTVQIAPEQGERNTRNNTRDVFVEILDNRDRILIVASAPHPDVAALNSALQSKESYEVEVMTADDFTADPDKYNLIIAHNLPDGRNNALFNRLLAAGTPVWFIIGGKSDIRWLNSNNSTFVITGNGAKSNRVSPVLNTSFPAFSLSTETAAYFKGLPPLYSPFGDVEGLRKDNVLLYQTLFGNQPTDNALLFFPGRTAEKRGWLLGTGIWRWRMTDYRRNGSFGHFDEWVGKMVQYLSVREDKSRFRVKVRKITEENEPVRFTAEFYDKTYSLTTALDVKLVVIDSTGARYDYSFLPRGNHYELDAGVFPPGQYRFEATVDDGYKKHVKNGVFIVKPIIVEWVTNRADFGLLQQLAARTGGEFFTATEMANIPAYLSERDIPSVSYTREKLFDLINLKWIIAVLLLLVTTEWVLRKRYGGY